MFAENRPITKEDGLFSWYIFLALTPTKQQHHLWQGRRWGGSMGAIAPIDFEKGLTAPINFLWKQGSKGILHPWIEILNVLLGILHPSIKIPNTPLMYLSIGTWFNLFRITLLNKFWFCKFSRVYCDISLPSLDCFHGFKSRVCLPICTFSISITFCLNPYRQGVDVEDNIANLWG